MKKLTEPCSEDHEEKFEQSWEAEKVTPATDLCRTAGGGIWDIFHKIQIVGCGAFGAVVLCQKSNEPDQGKVGISVLSNANR